MRNLFLVTAFLLIASIAIGQSFHKDGILSIHTLTLTPNEGVDMKDLTNFIEQKVVPAWEKELNCEIHLIKGFNRELKNKFGMIWYYKSKKSFNKHWNDDGSPTEKGSAAMKKLSDIRKEMKLLGTSKREIMNDWVVQ